MTAAEQHGWQPIETAPRSRHAILVWCPNYQNIYVVNWWDNGEQEPHWIHFGGIGGTLMEVPSHWQPLPPPPVTKE